MLGEKMGRLELPDQRELLDRARLIVHELRKIKLDLEFLESQDFGTQSGESYDFGMYHLECFDDLIKEAKKELAFYPDDRKYDFLQKETGAYSTETERDREIASGIKEIEERIEEIEDDCRSEQCQREVEEAGNEIAEARRTVRDAFKEDPDFKHSYIANIAMLLYDELGLKKEKRDEMSDKILRLIFD